MPTQQPLHQCALSQHAIKHVATAQRMGTRGKACAVLPMPDPNGAPTEAGKCCTRPRRSGQKAGKGALRQGDGRDRRGWTDLAWKGVELALLTAPYPLPLPRPEILPWLYSNLPCGLAGAGPSRPTAVAGTFSRTGGQMSPHFKESSSMLNSHVGDSVATYASSVASVLAGIGLFLCLVNFFC